MRHDKTAPPPAMFDVPAESRPSSPPSNAGEMEQALDEQVQKLQELGYLETHHNGLIALARAAARDVDWSTGMGAPSGRANLLRAMKEILEIIPQPEAASKDSLDLVVEAMRDAGNADELPAAYADQYL